MVDIPSATAEIRRGKKERKKQTNKQTKKKTQGKSIMSASATQGGHNNKQAIYIGLLRITPATYTELERKS